MKVIHRSDTLLVLEDRPWFLGIFMIAMALTFFAAGIAMLGEGRIVGGLLLGLFGGGIPLAIAAMMVLRVRLTFDRQAGQLTRISRSVAGLKQQEYALRRVVEARVGVSTDSDGSTYRMELDLRDPPETVPFTTYHTSGNRPQQMAAAVRDWLAADPTAIPSAGPLGNR